jgi:hypothetical protein
MDAYGMKRASHNSFGDSSLAIQIFQDARCRVGDETGRQVKTWEKETGCFKVAGRFQMRGCRGRRKSGNIT